LSDEAVQDKFVVVCVVPEAAKLVGAEGAVVSTGPPVTVMLALFTSKKMWLVPFTMILPVVVAVLGIVTFCEPSLGVAATRVVQLAPLFVDHKISTLAQLTPFAVVPATFQVIA
jgi:hypothetical protein